MNRRGAGMLFILISAFLFGLEYIVAAILHIGFNGYSDGEIVRTIYAVGYTPIVLSVISLIVGVIYLYIAEKEK